MPISGTNTLRQDGIIDMKTLSIGGTESDVSAAELTYLDLTTLGTGAASKAVVLDSGDDYTWPATGILTYGVLNDGTTALAATCLELNRTCDVSGRLIAGGGTLTITLALHDGKTVLWDQADGSVFTLPAATGTGMKLRFVVSVTVTSQTSTLVCVGSDEFAGQISQIDSSDDSIDHYPALAGDDFDTFTMNGGTQGGFIGDWVELEDIVSGTWAINGRVTSSGTAATPLTKAA